MQKAKAIYEKQRQVEDELKKFDANYETHLKLSRQVTGNMAHLSDKLKQVGDLNNCFLVLEAKVQAIASTILELKSNKLVK